MALPVWRRYEAVIEVDPAAGVVRVVGDNAARVEALARDIGRRGANRGVIGSGKLRALQDDDPPEAHVERVRRAQELIRAGDPPTR